MKKIEVITAHDLFAAAALVAIMPTMLQRRKPFFDIALQAHNIAEDMIDIKEEKEISEYLDKRFKEGSKKESAKKG